MANVLDVLNERGFVEQTTHDQELRDLFESEKVTCYIGFDPTASSLHIGSLVPIMALAHMQKGGHRPIALVGGGTGLVGDPSGKTEMRQILTQETIAENADGIKRQLGRFLDFSNDSAMMLNNADWLTRLEYIPFLRDIGRYFSVNRMLKAESCKLRLESEEGLSFIEFNYVLLQAYDFLELFTNYDCKLQMGGSDQWGNIVAGIELIRRVRQQAAFGITFPLITTSSGAKMGKTATGAIWLDPQRTSPYEYFQYWINSDDRDVVRFLSLFTFLPLEEIHTVRELVGAELNNAKTVLAFEATALAHGADAATAAHDKSANNFRIGAIPADLLPSSRAHRLIGPAQAAGFDSEIAANDLKAGIPAFRLFYTVGLANSGGAARRLIEQGGAYVNSERIEVFDRLVTEDDMDENRIIVLRSGKKKYHKVRVQPG
jgi:tyrosyl-tRNA synthetase